MKRTLDYIIILFVCVCISACENPSIDLADNDRSLYSERESARIVSTENNSNDIKPLEIEDFSVSDGKNDINLDYPYSDFKIGLIEKELDNNYVGEIFSGEYVYKYFCHEYEDFDLYTSNVNFNFKGRDFDEYFISQITLKTPAFKTYRGIGIGLSVEDLTNIYGSGEDLIEYGKTVLVYKLDDMEMKFIIDENKKIQNISLYVFASPAIN